MVIAKTDADDNQLLARLALALVDHPRATLQQLAKAVGIGKSTLHRFCNTREELIARLIQHSTGLLLEAARAANLEQGSPREALKRLISSHLEHRELAAFLLYHWKAVDMSKIEFEWESMLDAFFLRGQQLGCFRIDVAAASLTEALGGLLIGLIEAEHRGRVARVGMSSLVETLFLNGAQAPQQPAA